MGVTTCVISGVTTCICVSTTVRGGLEYNYRMIVVSDAVAEVDRDTHAAELKTMSRVFADVKTTDEVVGLLVNTGGNENEIERARYPTRSRPRMGEVGRQIGRAQAAER